MLTASDLRNYIMDGLSSDYVEVLGDHGIEMLAVITLHFHIIARQAIHDVAS